MNLGFLSRIGPYEIILILLVLVLLFGAKRIPELARALGKSLHEFRRWQEEGARRLLRSRRKTRRTPRSDLADA